MTEHVDQLEAYRVGARALASRILSAQEAERVRVSRELHDDTGQALTLLLIRLHLIEKRSTELEVKRELGELGRLVGETLDGVRRLAVHLGPSVLEDLGLRSAIEWLGDRVRAETGLTVSLSVEGDCDAVPAETAVAVFRVVQEALTNVVRHARAHHLDIRLSRSATALDIAVTDDGTGFAVDEARARPSASVGLFGMTERIALVGGRLEIASQGGIGTTVHAVIPIRNEMPS